MLFKVTSRALRQWHNYPTASEVNLKVMVWFALCRITTKRHRCAWFIQHTHSNDVIMSAMASQITGFSIVCSTVCSCADQRKYQSSVSLAFVRGIHRWSVDSPHKWPVTRKMFSFDDVIMNRWVHCKDTLTHDGNETWDEGGNLCHKSLLRVDWNSHQAYIRKLVVIYQKL